MGLQIRRRALPQHSNLIAAAFVVAFVLQPVYSLIVAPTASAAPPETTTIFIKGKDNEFTPASQGDFASDTYREVSFRFYSPDHVDRYELNGTTTDLPDDLWGDADYADIQSQLVQGLNTITLYGAEGGLSEATFVYDTVAPAFNVADESLFASSSVDVVVTEENIARITVDGEEVVYSGSRPTYSLTVTGEGKHTIVATDMAGNSTTIDFTIDSHAPIVTISGVTPNSDGSYTITGTSDAQTVTVRINGGPAITASTTDGIWTVTTAALGVGLYTVEASSTDAAGNTGTAPQFTFVVAPVETPTGEAPSTPEASPDDEQDKEDKKDQTSPIIAQLFDPSAAGILGHEAANNEEELSPLDYTTDETPDATADPAPTPDPNAPAGLAWYWWLAAPVAAGGLWWAVAAARSRE